MVRCGVSIGCMLVLKFICLSFVRRELLQVEESRLQSPVHADTRGCHLCMSDRHEVVATCAIPVYRCVFIGFPCVNVAIVVYL